MIKGEKKESKGAKIQKKKRMLNTVKKVWQGERMVWGTLSESLKTVVRGSIGIVSSH
jgi:hypothetical protein